MCRLSTYVLQQRELHYVRGIGALGMQEAEANTAACVSGYITYSVQPEIENDKVIHLLLINGHLEFITTGICLFPNSYKKKPNKQTNKLQTYQKTSFVRFFCLYFRIYKTLLLYLSFRQDNVPDTHFDTSFEIKPRSPTNQQNKHKTPRHIHTQEAK